MSSHSHSHAAATPATATSAPKMLVVPRPPLNPYRKIAIIRNPATDVVICEDVENPGKFKRVVVGDLVDPTKEKQKKEDQEKEEYGAKKGQAKEGGNEKSDENSGENNNKKESNNNATTTTTTTTKTTTNVDKKEQEKQTDNNSNKQTTSSKSKSKKTEIPVPTITNVKNYTTDIPPTYPIPNSYVRYTPPSYHQVMENTIEYNIDGEDELWWRQNESFGPESKARVVWKTEEEFWSVLDQEKGEDGRMRNVWKKSLDMMKENKKKRHHHHTVVGGDKKCDKSEHDDNNNDDQEVEEDFGKNKSKKRRKTSPSSSSKKKGIEAKEEDEMDIDEAVTADATKSTTAMTPEHNAKDTKPSPPTNTTTTSSSKSPTTPNSNITNTTTTTTSIKPPTKPPSIQEILLTNPIYLHSPHSTRTLIHKYQPRLPLMIMEQMMDILEKATGFETIITENEARELFVKKIPRLEDIFGSVEIEAVEDDGNGAGSIGGDGGSGKDGGGNASGGGVGGSNKKNKNPKRATNRNHKLLDRVNGRFVSRKNKDKDDSKSKDDSKTTTTTTKKGETKKTVTTTTTTTKEESKSKEKEAKSTADTPSAVAAAAAEAARSLASSKTNDIKKQFTPSPKTIDNSPSFPPDTTEESSPDQQEHHHSKEPQPTLIPFLAPPVTLQQVIRQIYNYWINKRSKLKKPLLRRYWPVTSTNDVNPHMVFRPREKEKRKLRKKRQNDMEAYKKMKQLKMDFERVRVLCDLVMRREKAFSTMVELSNEYFEERMYQWLDTSGLPRESRVLNREMIESAVLDVPKYFDDGPILGRVKGGKKRKRSSASGAASAAAVAAASGVGVSSFQPMDVDSRGPSPVPPSGVSAAASAGAAAAEPIQPAAKVTPSRNVVVAGHDGGYPAPSFLDPLASRESHYVTSWENAVPFLPSYQDGKAIPSSRFRHRPRLGRGGRIVIDRLPCPSSAQLDPDDPPPPTVITYGSAMKRSGYHIDVLGADGPNFNPINHASKKGGENAEGTNATTAPRAPPAQQMQDLLPRSLGDPKMLSRRIEEICAMGLMEDYQTLAETSNATKGAAGAVGAVNDEGVDEVLVPIEDWMEAPDGQIYGKERFVIGPL